MNQINLPTDVSLWNMSWGFAHIMLCKIWPHAAENDTDMQNSLRFFEYVTKNAKSHTHESLFEFMRKCAGIKGFNLLHEMSDEMPTTEGLLVLSTPGNPPCCSVTMPDGNSSVFDREGLPEPVGPFHVFSVQDAGASRAVS